MWSQISRPEKKAKGFFWTCLSNQSPKRVASGVLSWGTTLEPPSLRSLSEGSLTEIPHLTRGSHGDRRVSKALDHSWEEIPQDKGYINYRYYPGMGFSFLSY